MPALEVALAGAPDSPMVPLPVPKRERPQTPGPEPAFSPRTPAALLALAAAWRPSPPKTPVLVLFLTVSTGSLAIVPLKPVGMFEVFVVSPTCQS